MTVPCTEMNGLVLVTKLLDAALVSMNIPPMTVTCCHDSECTISAVESENGLLKPYLANRRAVVIGKFQEWKEKFPETDFELLQHIAGPLNPADCQLDHPAPLQKSKETLLGRMDPTSSSCQERSGQ